MPASKGLQKKFDSQAKKRDISGKLDDLRDKIDPAFLASFESFRIQVLDIVDDSPETTDIVSSEVDSLETKLERVHKKRKIKTFDTITEQI